ncbi:MAG: CPBP family intramembrane glutamic endopeptidase [Cytophagales bacterium]
MKKFLNYLKSYLLNSYSLKRYSLFLLFTGLLIAINFYLDFEDEYIDAYYGQNIRILWYALLQGIPYLACLILFAYDAEEKFYRDKIFWLKFLIGFGILGFDRSFHYHYYFIQDLPSEIYVFVSRTIKSGSGIVTNVFLLLLVYLAIDYRKRLDRFYGFTFKDVDYKAYGYMMLLMLPLIFAASFLPDFIDYYPKYKKTLGWNFASYYNLEEWIPIVIYEIAYLSDFISIELFFRGFLILGMAPHLGKHVVLPMVCSYAVLHFGKPLGECISSVFGGYILGVIALYSRNIWGGVVLHMGVAAFMELFAFIQLALRN